MLILYIALNASPLETVLFQQASQLLESIAKEILEERSNVDQR
jgi:hypothetical protein